MGMSLFDQPYYALTKGHMSRIGLWPEQSKYARIIRPLILFTISSTLAVPGFLRLRGAWRDIDILARNTTVLLMGIGIFFVLLRAIQQIDNIKLVFKIIEKHWETFKNTPAVIVLDRYAEQGRYIALVYSSIYGGMILFYVLCLSPIILDFVDPINETRPKIYIVKTEYGVDADKYYWLIIAHTYIVASMMLSAMVAIETMYILLVVHSCALFEVVGVYLELIANKDAVNMENAITLRSDWNYKKICECIILHAEAINFADMIEDGSSASAGITLGIIVCTTVISGVYALINWNHTEELIQQVTLIIGQLLHLYIMSIPGQELINHSGRIHTIACI